MLLGLLERQTTLSPQGLHYPSMTPQWIGLKTARGLRPKAASAFSAAEVMVVA